MSAAPVEALAGEPKRPSLAMAWYGVAILSLGYMMSYADRVIINLLARPIKADLGLSDTEFGLLTGVAFGVLYTALAFPLGRMCDLYSRRWIMCLGVALFSAFSISSGFALTFGALFIARVGVGAGEAALTPAAHSLIRGTFPPDKMAFAMSLFVTSAFVGSGCAYIGGGALVHALDQLGDTQVPLLGVLKPWQMAFVWVGLPGLLIAPLLLTVREPKREASEKKAQLPLKEVGRQLWVLRPTLVPLLLGFSFLTLGFHAGNVWKAPFFDRTFGWDARDFGFYYGVTYIIFAPGGALFAGWLCDKLTRRGMLDAPVRISAFAALAGGLAGAVAPLMPNATAAMVVFAPTIFFQTFSYPLAATAIQLIAPNGMRAQLAAFYMVVLGIAGQGFGPVAVGFMTDNLFSAPEDLRYSLAIVNAVSGPVAMICLLLAMKPFASLRRAAA